MEAIMRKHPRSVGVAIFLLGIGLAVWLKHTYDTGSATTEKAIVGVPMVLLYGLAITVQPRLMLLKGEFGSAPTVVKAMIILIAIVGVGLGFLLRHLVFGAWQ
jgi:drug/metabolite transporter (DMT)-like permease